MYKGYKIVSVTPAGRRESLEILLPYLLANKNYIDEHHFWLNTKITKDIQYIKEITKKHKKFLKIVKNDIPVNGIESIHRFFKYCVKNDTIYIRFDDDICWIAPDAIKNLLDFRISHPDYFLVFPQIVNNAMNAVESSPFKNFPGRWYEDPKHAYKKHLYFLENLGNIEKFKVPDFEHISDGRFNINCISWFGSRFAEFNGKVGIEEEIWLARIQPDRINAVCGSSLVVHYAFRTQKEFLSKTDVLNQYRMLSKQLIKM